MSTTVWAAMDGLEAAMQGWPSLQALQHCRIGQGFPPGGPLERYEIWIPAEVDNLERISDVSGNPGYFTETYELRTYATVAAVAEKRWDDHRHLIEEVVDGITGAVGADPQLGGAVSWAVVGRIRIGESFRSEEVRQLDAAIWIPVQAYVCP